MNGMRSIGRVVFEQISVENPHFGISRYFSDASDPKVARHRTMTTGFRSHFPGESVQKKPSQGSSEPYYDFPLENKLVFPFNPYTFSPAFPPKDVGNIKPSGRGERNNLGVGLSHFGVTIQPPSP
jgi:hypothetical protein